MKIFKKIKDWAEIIVLSPLGLPYFLYYLIKRLFSPNDKTKKIVILGEQGCGKTMLWCQLQSIPYRVAGVNDKIERFRLGEKEDGTPVYVETPYDIAGGDKYVSDYETMIEDGTFIYYLVELPKLEEKRNTTRERLRTIAGIIQKKKLENCGLNIVGTYFDEFNGNREEAKKYIQSIIFDKKVKGIEPELFHAINTTNSKDVEIIRKEILKSIE